MLDVLLLPLAACLVLAGIHVHLGLHVLARGVIFVDLALAQVAALGMAVAFLAGHPLDSAAASAYALGFALAGAALLAATRTRGAVPQEAVIGIVYAASAAAAVLVVDRAPQGAEHVKQLLVGSILTVSPAEVLGLAGLYAAVGALHWAVRRPLLEISLDPAAARARGRALAGWDLVFYASFALVVTSSVRVAGVLLVFAYLVVPATAAALLARGVAARLALGWGLAGVVSVLGLGASWAWDLPTGAALVVAFAGALAVLALALAAGRLGTAIRARGAVALRALAVATAGATGLAGVLLAAAPGIGHVWLDALEAAVPAIAETFLTPHERATRRESLASIARYAVERERLARREEAIRWGTRASTPEETERLRQFLAGRGELSAGEHLVLATLRARARQRQRFPLGLPLAAGGAAAVFLLLRPSARRPRGPWRGLARRPRIG